MQALFVKIWKKYHKGDFAGHYSFYSFLYLFWCDLHLLLKIIIILFLKVY